MKNIAIVGAGGMGRELKAQMLDNDPSLIIDFFVEDKYVTEGTSSIYSIDPDRHIVFVAVGEPDIKRRLVSLIPKGVEFGVFVHRSAQIFGNVEFGEGTVVCANCVVTTDVIVGRHATLNRGVQIGHDSVIGDFFSAMPGAVVSGNCSIGDCVYLGTNSSIREKLTITSNVIIGLCSGVVKNIQLPGVYGGVPAVSIK